MKINVKFCCNYNRKGIFKFTRIIKWLKSSYSVKKLNLKNEKSTFKPWKTREPKYTKDN